MTLFESPQATSVAVMVFRLPDPFPGRPAKHILCMLRGRRCRVKKKCEEIPPIPGPFRIPLTRGAGELALLTDRGTPTAPADN
jgi:hypothetical protein